MNGEGTTSPSPLGDYHRSTKPSESYQDNDEDEDQVAPVKNDYNTLEVRKKNILEITSLKFK